MREIASPPSERVAPPDVEALRALVEAAREQNECLVVASSGPPHFKDGLACAEAHRLVDLAAWKQIDLIDRRNRVCRIQPGVTYGALLDALAPHGMTIPMPLAPRRSKSVLAAVLDREPSTWPNRQWDASDPLGSTELVFGSGELFRTGAAGGPGSIEAQRKAGGAQKFSSGPSHTDFHRVVQGSQGTMGIVTWATLRAELKPSIEDPHILGADSLHALIPFVYSVQRAMLGEQTFVLNRHAAALLMAHGDEARFGSLEESLPAFICLQNIAGFERLPEERLTYQRDDIRGHARQQSLRLDRELGGLSAVELLARANDPHGELDWRCAKEGGCLSVFFLSTLDRAPKLIDIFTKCALEHAVLPEEIGVYVQPIVQNHGCHIELLLPYHTASSHARSRAGRIEQDAVGRLLDAGAFFSRPYGAAQRVFEKNPGNFSLVRQVKSLFDPNRILHRGKWGL